MAVAIRYNTFVAWGTDSSSYVEAARQWSEGRLSTPMPLQFWDSWTNTDPFALTPLGRRPGAIRGTEVGTYPLGLSVLMAAGIRIGGELGAYVIPPIGAGLLVFCSYVLASWLAGPGAGVLGAMLVAASPVTVVMAAQPMSDIPAAALWALAWVMSLRPGLGASAAAGAAVAAATMVRPNLSPLAAIVMLLVAHREHGRPDGESRWRRLGVFLCVAAIGPLVLGWSQLALYGSPFTMGYHPSLNIPRWVHVQPNLELYPRLLNVIHTPIVFAGLLAPALLSWFGAGVGRGTRARAVLWSAPAFIVVTYLLYSPFPPLDDLFSLRFMLPGLVALFILFSGLTIGVARAIGSRVRFLAPLALVPALIVMTHPTGALRFMLTMRDGYAPAAAAGYYMREALPPNAAIIAGLHSGAMAYYTGRFIVRVEFIPLDGIDAVVDDLIRRGYRPVLFLDQGEVDAFGARHHTSRFGALDWPPRADFPGPLRLRYWDIADLAAFRAGQRWATDVVTMNPSIHLK